MSSHNNDQIEGLGEEQNTQEFGPWLPLPAESDLSPTIAQLSATILKLQEELSETRSQTEALAAWGNHLRSNPDALAA